MTNKNQKIVQLERGLDGGSQKKFSRIILGHGEIEYVIEFNRL